MSTLLKLAVPAPERIVVVSDSEGFGVRGLSPVQVVTLYRRHSAELEARFGSVMAAVARDGASLNDDIAAAMMTLIDEAPVLIAEIIVLASGGSADSIDDFDEARTIASTLAFAVQVDALVKIADLTFTSEMPPGKFLALVVSLARKAAGAIAQRT